MNKGKHFDEGKAPIHLIPSEAITAMAHALGMGAKKYGEYNFRYGMDHTKIIDSLLRHTLAYLAGEDNDPESGLSHIWHIGANYAMLEYLRIHHPEMDNRFKDPKNDTDDVKFDLLDLKDIPEQIVGITYEGKLMYDPMIHGIIKPTPFKLD